MTDHFMTLEQNTDLDRLVEESAALLHDDGVILTPTDTVYGLICLPDSDRAIQTIFEMKERPLSRHLPVIVADQRQAEEALPLLWNEAAKKLADRFWPGALTIACGVLENDLKWLSGRVEVGVRAPKHPFIQKLARKVGPFFMTSANRHGEDVPHTVEGALGSLSLPPALAIDGGPLSGAPSTLVNVNLPVPKVERAGCIPVSEIEKAIQA